MKGSSRVKVIQLVIFHTWKHHNLSCLTEAELLAQYKVDKEEVIIYSPPEYLLFFRVMSGLVEDMWRHPRRPEIIIISCSNTCTHHSASKFIFGLLVKCFSWDLGRGSTLSSELIC